MRTAESQDAYWQDAATFVRTQGLPTSRVVAPREMGGLLPGLIPYERAARLPLDGVDALVIHKGLLHELGSERLQMFNDQFAPAFANEIFVVLSRGKSDRRVRKSPHYLAYLQMLQDLVQEGTVAAEPSTSHTILGATPFQELAREIAMASPPTTVYLGDHRALTRTIFGQKMFVDTRDVALAPHLMLDGYWEAWITAIFRELVRPGMTVVDVGANYGYYTLLGGAAVGREGNVHAFEANPGVANILSTNVRVNGFDDRTVVIPKAVYSKSTTVEFHCWRNHPASSSLWPGDAAAFNDSIEMVQVEAIALDEYFAPGTKVDVIKVDVEGAEAFVMEGARRVLSENRKIHVLLEVSAPRLERTVSGEMLRELIRDLGFRMRHVRYDGSMVPVQLEDLAEFRVCEVLLDRE